MRRFLPLFVALLAGACGGPRQAPPDGPAKPNLLLISIDTLRADHLGCYGYPRATSPNLDRLAREGVVFERAWATAAWTLPSHASLFTGLYPAEHGVVNDRTAISPERELLPEALAALGYRSAGVVSSVAYLRRDYGFAQGWESYDDRTLYREAGVVGSASVSADLHRLALAQLDTLGAGPFFLFLHDFDVHADYVPPPPFETMFGPRRSPGPPPRGESWQARRERTLPQYDGEIAWVDSWVGKLLDELRRRDLLERTVVAVVSDHGEEFHEHGSFGHGANLYDTVLHVPWIVRFPGARWAGRRIAEPVSLVDVPATLLALAGSGERRWNSGRDVSRWLLPGARPEPADLFAFRLRRPATAQLAILSGGDKALLRLAGGERPALPAAGLYRLGADPEETRNLAPFEGARVRELHGRAVAAIAAQLGGQRALPALLRGRLSQEEEARLRALGYL